MRFDDAELVLREYASEQRLTARRAVFTDLVEGPNAEDLAYEAVREISPSRVLEVGCGTGVFAERITRELECTVVALDVSPRMVELTRSRGVDARLGDVQALPFPDGEFDCAVANWVLYHVPDLDRALSELLRVLKPGGRFIAATFGEDHLSELWAALDNDHVAAIGFSRESAANALRRHFAHVERRDADAAVFFPDRRAVRAYVAATISGSHLAERVDEVAAFARSFRARSRQSVFVAGKAA